MASVFGKLRREAKEKAKKNKEQISEGMTEAETAVMKDVKEVDPVSAEELTQLLNSLNEEVKEEPTQPLSTKVKEPEVIKSEPTTKVFKAYGLYYDSKRKKFIKVTMEYNPTEDTAKIVDRTDLADSIPVAGAKISQVFNLKLMRAEEVL